LQLTTKNEMQWLTCHRIMQRPELVYRQRTAVACSWSVSAFVVAGDYLPLPATTTLLLLLFLQHEDSCGISVIKTCSYWQYLSNTNVFTRLFDIVNGSTPVTLSAVLWQWQENMQCLYATSKDAASVQEKSTNWFVNGEMPVAYLDPASLHFHGCYIVTRGSDQTNVNQHRSQLKVFLQTPTSHSTMYTHSGSPDC